MRLSSLLLALLFVWAGSGRVAAQHGLHLSLFPELIQSQQFQPANINEGDLKVFSVGLQGNFWVNNSDFSLEGIVTETGLITQDTRNRIIDELNGQATVNGGLRVDYLMANFNVKGHRLGVFINENIQVSGQFNEPHTAGLALLGNAPYAGQTLTDSDIFGRLYHTRELGIGYGWGNDKIQVGGRVKLIEGIRMIDLDHLNYSIFTHPDGTQIQLQADYQYQLTLETSNVPFFDFQGIGFGADLGIRYRITDAIDVEAAMLDLGTTTWDVKQYDNNIDINWEGISINSLFDDDVPQSVEDEVDSLTNLILIDSVLTTHQVAAPLTLRAGATWRISDKDRLGGNIVYVAGRTGSFAPLPLFNVGYRRDIIEGLSLAANAYGGGGATYGFGLSGAYVLSVKEDWKIHIFIASDHLIGWVSPEAARGLSVYGGVGVRY